MDNFKNLAFFSVIFGLVSGILGLIPIFGIIVLIVLMFCSSFIIMVFMKKMGYMVCNSEAESMLFGGISGFISFIGFSISFFPIAFILSLIFKESYYTGISIIIKNGFVITLMIVLSLGILCAMMNAFSGLASIYVFSNIKPSQKKFTLNIGKGKKNGFKLKDKND